MKGFLTTLMADARVTLLSGSASVFCTSELHTDMASGNSAINRLVRKSKQ